MKFFRYLFFISFCLMSSVPCFSAETWGHDYHDEEAVNIRNVNGKLYAYIVLLYNENPHFVNLIQKGSIPAKLMGTEGFHLNAYRNYLKSLADTPLEKLASGMLKIYLDPYDFSDAQLLYYEVQLARHNIVLKFSRENNTGSQRISLDYCIYGKRTEITVRHPLIDNGGRIYNIRPYLYYDEFSTSNSTFYYDMIYISQDEVANDCLIASHIMADRPVKTMFFVGSRITDDIRFCIHKAFDGKTDLNHEIRKEIWETFVIHELTHKYINNRYNYFDQVNGEELALVSTVYSRPYLGLSILYSYLNYNSINPHRIAASNFVSFVAGKTGKKDIVSKPGIIKTLPEENIRQLARDYFFLIEGKLE